MAADPLVLQPWQWGVLAGVYVLFFVLPARWMWRKARADGDQAFVWTVLVLVGSILGILEYRHHRSILARRARRAEKAKKVQADAGGEAPAGRGEGSGR